MNIKYPHIIEANNVHFVDKDSLCNYITYNKKHLLSLLQEIGGILFRGFNLINELDFEQVVRSLNPNLGNYTGGDSPRTKISEKIYTSTEYPPEFSISLHHEKSFSNTYPYHVYFFCQIPPHEGGETPILDSRKLYQSLTPELIDTFKNKKLKYIMNLHSGSGIGRSWRDSYEVNDKEALEKILKTFKINYRWKEDDILEVHEIVQPIIKHPLSNEYVFFSQADQWHISNLDKEIVDAMSEIIPEENFFHNCLHGDGSEINIEHLQEIREKMQENMVTFPWKKGDLLMLDNIISMHGRMPYKGLRKILVSMS